MPADPPLPRLLFQTAFPLPVWRLWPAPDVLAVEVRDAVARTVLFVVLAEADGRELFRYHDPVTPWWLTLAGMSAEGMLLTELNPSLLGQPVGQRMVAVPGLKPPELRAAPPAWLRPDSHLVTGAYFAPLARLIEQQTGVQPTKRIELLETTVGSLLGFERAKPESAEQADGPAYELLLVGLDGTLMLRVTLAGAPVGPDDPRFCTFGPILYACGAPGEILAWALPES